MTPTAAGFRIRFCTWCKQIDLRGERREADVIVLYVQGKDIRGIWNGRNMIVQDGICERCSQRLHPKAIGSYPNKEADPSADGNVLP